MAEDRQVRLILIQGGKPARSVAGSAGGNLRPALAAVQTPAASRQVEKRRLGGVSVLCALGAVALAATQTGCGATGSGTAKQTTTTTSTENLPSEQAEAASDFTNSVGVVTHLSYTDTPYYTEFPQVLQALQTLGVHHIRDGFYPWASNSPIVQAHRELAKAGIKTDYVVPFSVSTTPTQVATLASLTGDMEQVEAPNECDVTGACGPLTSLVGFLPVVHGAAGKVGVPAVGPSFVLQATYPQVGDLDSDMSVNNLHIYFGGRNPGSTGWGAKDAEGHAYGSFDWWLDQAAIDGPGKPVEITETGYIATGSGAVPFTVPESVEASYIPRTLLLAFKRGFTRTLLYELLDEKSSPGYGLLRSDLSPKPAFTAVKSLLTTLADDGTGTFTAGSLPYTISGGGAALNHLLLQKRDGSYWLVLWLEESSWDPAHTTHVAVTPENIALQVGSAFKTTKDFQFDASGDVTPFNQPMTGDVANLTVTDQVSVVEIVQK